MKMLDMQGKPCPIPVIEAKKVLAQPGAEGVVVLVDNMVAVQNLQKMAEGYGFTYSWKEQGADLYEASILAQAGAKVPMPAAAQQEKQAVTVQAGGATVLITADSMGRGDEKLGKMLIKGFIFSLTELPTPPKEVIFLNGGVKLAVEGANTLEDLQTLVSKGTAVCACGTCLNYYELTDKLQVGEIVDMFAISTKLAAASKVITL